jgi:predicted DNA-binding protein with PD1-like motif
MEIPLRLHPGADLRRELEALAIGLGGAAFVIAGIGGLAEVHVRLAAEEHETKLDGPFELLSLAGTLSKDGAHLHMSVADAKGQVIGGHVCYGNKVRTTAEVLLIKLDGWQFSREHDGSTGFKELVIHRRGVGEAPEGAA